MTLFQIIFVPLCASVSLVVFSRTLRRHVVRRNGFFWSGLWMAAAGMIALPAPTAIVARWLGIGRGADLVFYFAILAGLAACVYFYSQNRRLEIMITEIARNEALNSARHGETSTPQPSSSTQKAPLDDESETRQVPPHRNTFHLQARPQNR
jgi:hypothetical protein